MCKKIRIIMLKQEIEVASGEEFQLRGRIETAGVKFLLLCAIAQSETFLVCQEQFNDNKKHWIENEDTFDELGKRYGFGWKDVPNPITLDKINEYETGDTILWDKAKQEFVVGKKAKDIYFPEEPEPNGMRGTWCELDDLGAPASLFFKQAISFNWAEHSSARQEKTLASALKYGIGYIPYLYHIVENRGLEKTKALVKRYKDHEAIIAWLAVDEPQLQRIVVSKQREFYEAIKAIDSNRPVYTAFMPAVMKPEYYNPDTFDAAILNGYPVRDTGDWKDQLNAYLNTWVQSTGNKKVIANMQGFHSENCDNPDKDWANPIGTIQGQYDIWRSLVILMGYFIYAFQDGAGSKSTGIDKIPGMLEEVRKFNEVRR